MNIMGDIFDAIQQGNIKKLSQFLKRTSKLPGSPKKFSISDSTLNTINRPNKFGSTPLMMAAMSGTKHSNEIFRLLLQYGARSDMRDMDGYTIAHVVLKYGNSEKIRILIEHDTECFLIPDNQGRLPVDLLELCSERSSDIDELKEVLVSISQPNFAFCYKAEPDINYKVMSKNLLGSLKNIKRYNEKFNHAILDAGYKATVQPSRCGSDLSLYTGLDFLIRGFDIQDVSGVETCVSKVDASALTCIAYGMGHLNQSIEVMRYIEGTLPLLSYQGQLTCIYLMKEIIASDIEGELLSKKAFTKTYKKIWLQIDTESSEMLATLKVIMDRIIDIRDKYNQQAVQFLNLRLDDLEADILLPHRLGCINLSHCSADSKIILVEDDFDFSGALTSKQFAENIYLLDQVGYLSVSNKDFNSKNKTLLSDFQNLLTNKVRYDILSTERLEDKARVIDFYCDVANILLNKHQDQQGFLGVVTGLSIINEKMMSYLSISNILKDRITFLQDCISPFGNFKYLRTHAKENNNVLPAFQILLSDIAHVMDAGLEIVEKAGSLGKLLLPISIIKDELANRDVLPLLLSDDFQLRFLSLVVQLNSVTESDISSLRDELREEIEQAEQLDVVSTPIVPRLNFTPLFDGSQENAQSSSRSWLERTFSSRTPKSSKSSHNKKSPA